MAKQVTSIGLSVLLLFVAVSASPLRKKGCQGSKLGGVQTHYESGHTYVYNFEGHTVSSLPGQQGDGVKIHVKATAEISIEDDCQGVLKINNIQVTGPDSQKYAHLEYLEGHPVAFDFEGGVVGRDLSTVDEDSEHSVNLKRAILSLFQLYSQNTIISGRSNVLDVFGLCPTEFSISERGSSAYITKFKNLNNCQLRENLRQDFASVTYHIASDLQTTPLLDSTQEVKQHLKGGVLSSAESHEKYLYKPFSNQDAGAKTLVESKLTLVSHNKKAPPSVSGNTVRSIVFEPPRVHIGASNAAAVVDALHKAHEAMPHYVGENAAREFSNVVTIVRETSKDDLLSVYGQVSAGAGFKDKNAATRMFLDALFRAGTGAAVEVAVELLKSNKITGTVAELYYLQFAYTKHVTKSALTAAVSLLDLPNPPKLAFLGVGALGGRYCNQHNCDGVPEVDAFLEKLSHSLDSGCKVSSYDEEVKVIAALKALHNVHHLNDAVINKLKTCVLDDHVPTRVRAAVLDVFQSDACKTKEISLEVLKNIQLDSELRIKAFLALIECPCNKMANPIKELLDAEPSYQVGSFITSYLRNLRATTNPSKEHQKAVYGEIRTTKRFPIDLRKFSNNFEYSYMLGGLNIGTTSESNLIYSQKSFLPRVSTLNLTSELFGHSINFLEVEFRQENLDLLAEGLFGPKGYFGSHSWSEVVKSGKEKWTDVENTVKQRLNQAIRGKRSVTKEDLYGVQEKSTTPYSSEPDRELLLEFSTRLFGAEVGWFTFHHNARDAANNAFDTTFKTLEKVVKKLKDFDYKLRQCSTFLDTELVYPTALGLPLKLAVKGSSALHVELDGKIDLNQLINDFKNSELHFKFVPSANVEVVGAFVVDAYAVEAGLKVATTLHTATGSDITVKATDGVGVDVTLGLPVQKQDVLTLKTEVLSTVQELGKPEVDKEIALPGTPKRSYHGCFDQLSRLIGLTFCGTMNFPWDPVASKAAFFPLNGPSKLSLVIENEDVTRYHFRASLNNADPNKKSLELLLETPGSQTDRKLALLLERTFSPYQGVKAHFSSPWKHISMELAFTDSDEEISLLAKATNDADEYFVKLGASVTGDSSHATYHPLLEYKTPEKRGNLVAQKGAKGKPEKLRQPFSVSGSVTVDKTSNSRKYTFNDVVFTIPQGEYKVQGSVEREGSSTFGTDLKIHYGNHYVVLISSFKRPSPQIYHVKFNVQPSQYPDFGINLIWDSERDKNNIKNSLAVVHGSDPENHDARFTLSQEAHYQFENIHNFKFSTKNEVTYPLLGIVGKFDASAEPKNLHVDVEASYEKHKFESELTVKTGVNSGDYDIDFHAKVLDSSLQFKSKLERVAPKQSKFSTELEIHPGGKYTLVADVTHAFERNDINFQLDAVANIHGQADDYKFSSGLIYNQHLFDTHYKLVIGSVEYVDISANFKKAPGDNPSGNAKVFLKNYLIGNAQFKYASGKGSATLNIDIPKLGRKLKGTGDLQVTGTHHVATVELYYNVDKNPNQKITFRTDTDYRKDAIDSKNELNVLNHVTVVNFKGTLTGKLEDGQLNGDFDISLPNDYKLGGKLDQTLHVRPANSEGDVKVELTVKAPSNTLPSIVTLEFAAKNVDSKQYSFDGQSKLAYHSPTGKDIALVVAAKNIAQREQRVIEAQGTLQGSFIGEPIHVNFNSEVHETYVAYKGHGSYGNGAVVDLSGKVSKTLKYHDNHYSGPFSIDTAIEAKLPFEKVKHIKYADNLAGQAEENKLQFVYSQVIIVDEKTYKIEIDSNTELDKGNNKIVINFPNSEPKTYVSSWYFSHEDYKNNDLVKGGFSVSGNQDTKLTVDVNGKKDWSDFSVHATVHTPYEKFRNAELTLKNKYHRTPRLEVDTDFVFIVDEKKLTIVNKVTPGPFSGIPNIDFTATHPEGKTRVYFFLQSKSSNDVSGKAELEWATNGGGKLTASGKANYESPQNFKIEADVESPKLNLKKWHVMLANKPSKSAKTIQIQATEAGVQVINGRLEYHVEEKENSYKAGVSGTVKVRNQNQQLKADVSYRKFSPAEDGELGAQSALTVHLGEKSFEALSKYTNKESRAKVSLCYKADECSISELYSVVKVTEFSRVEHDFGATVDLKASGINEGFILVGKTVSEPKSFDHAVELKLLNAKHTTYKFHSYLNEHALGTVLTLPQRVIATEGKLSYNKEKGERILDINFWLDKERHPENKAGLYMLVVVNPNSGGTELKGDVKLSHPSLQKDIAITSKAVVFQGDTLFDGTVDFDIFAKSNQKITLEAKFVRIIIKNGYGVTGHISAKGKLIDVNIEGEAELSIDKASYISKLTYQDEKHKTKTAEITVLLTSDIQQIHVKSPTAELLKIEQKLTVNENERTLKGEAVIIGVEPIVFEEVINVPVSSKATLYKKNKPNEKLIIDSLHDIMKGFNIRLTTVCDGASKDVLYIGVDLTDQHFLQTHFTWSTTDLKSLLEQVVHDLKEALKQSEVVSKDFGNEVTDEMQGFLEAVKKAQPDFKRVISSYQTQIKELKEELENDEGFTEASENMKKIIKAVTKVVVELTKRMTELAEHTLELVNKVIVAVQESLSKIIPKVKEFYIKLVEFWNVSVVRAILDFASTVLHTTADFIKEHDEDIRKLVEVVKDFFEDVGKVVGTTIVQVRNEVVGFVKLMVEQVKALPAYENLKEQYTHFVSQLSQYLVPEQTWSVIKEIIGPFKDSLPTQELRDFVNAVEEYVDKRLNKEPLNDSEELQALLNKAIKALKSLVTLVTDHLPKGDTTKEYPSFLGLRMPVAMNALFELPKAVALRYSPIQFLTSGNLRELPTLQEFLLTLKPSLNPKDWVPPYRAHGVLIQLEHFVTLDGRHFTFKGTCAYVLLQDVVDGNFSVALDFATKSLIVTDRHDTVELFQDSKIKVNGHATEFPYVSGEFVAWRDFESVNLNHKAGLFVKCDSHYSYCFFYVNGYYFGKTQGLLGVLDYEPFDDFRQPNGQIVSNVNDFGNSWKVNPSCGDVTGATHHDHHMPEPPECANVFGGNSPLKLGYLVSPVAPYREACTHIVADAGTPDAKKQAACATGAAYVTSTRSQYFPISLPSECVHCSVVGGNPVQVQDSVSVRVPQKSADIVIVVEQVTTNSELFKDLITPLVTTLTAELKSKGVTDVHFTLIGFGEATYNYPVVYTSSGKLSFEGKTKNIKFTDYVDLFSLKLDNCHNKFKYLKAVIESELGLAPPSRAYQFASTYPFKIATSKALVGVVGTTKTSAFSLSLQHLGALYSTKVLRDRGVAFHLVAPVEDLHLDSGDAKTLKSIVGFDSDRVFVLGDAKRKESGGNTELRKHLTYKNNIWIPIALESYGISYVAQNFVDAKPAARKQFLQVFSHRIVDSLLTPLHEDCTCKLVNGIHPFSECKVTGRVEREPYTAIKGTKGQTKG